MESEGILDSATEEQESSPEQKIIIVPQESDPHEFKPHIVKFYGEINTETCSEIIEELYFMKELSREWVHSDLNNPESELVMKYNPFEVLISTDGGSVSDMFAVYDVMKHIQKDCEISTFGVGQVSSAGVLLLAAGTKGKRKIGKHCNVMIHEVSGGGMGTVREMKNDTAHMQHIRNQYINALVSETNMSRRKILALLRKRVDIYFTAEEALKLGIIDEII